MQSMRARTGATRVSAKPGRPVTLLDSDSPYGSRRVMVEYESDLTYGFFWAIRTRLSAPFWLKSSISNKACNLVCDHWRDSVNRERTPRLMEFRVAPNTQSDQIVLGVIT